MSPMSPTNVTSPTTTAVHDHQLDGLDGTNPLAYLAALGALAAADAAAPGARLAWRNLGRWRPVLSTALDRAALVAALAADVRTWDGDPAIGLSYSKRDDDGGEADGASPPRKAKKKPGGDEKVARDLKPSPARFRAYLGELLTGAGGDLAAGFLVGRRRPLDYAAAFGSELVTDNNGNVKPTALHFTAGQQEFLKAVLALVEGVTAADLEEALFGPWRYDRQLPVMGWDATASRDYALRADDPSKDKKVGVPGADWLAFRGLAFVPVAPRDELVTAGCGGGWKTGHFTWCLWTPALSPHAVRTALVLDRPDQLPAHERRARGLELVLRSGIRRSDQGGYGSFLPADVRPPPRR